MGAAERRAQAARWAFRHAVSDTGVHYSPRDLVVEFWGEGAADFIEDQIAHSAADPGVARNQITLRHRVTTLVSPINFGRYQRVVSEHISYGEIRGVEHDITQAYRRRLRQLRRR